MTPESALHEQLVKLVVRTIWDSQSHRMASHLLVMRGVQIMTRMGYYTTCEPEERIPSASE
jgi:hypothetical protein